MDYVFEKNKDVFNSLLLDKANVVDFDNFEVFDLETKKDAFSNFSFLLYCLSFCVNKNNKNYQRLLQFFILSAYKKNKYNNFNHDTELSALAIAFDRYKTNYYSWDDEKNGTWNKSIKEQLNKVQQDIKYDKQTLINFYSKIEVLSDWDVQSSSFPVKFHEEPTQKNESIFNAVVPIVGGFLSKVELPAKTLFKEAISFVDRRSELDLMLNGVEVKTYWKNIDLENIPLKDRLLKKSKFLNLYFKHMGFIYEQKSNLDDCIDHYFDPKISGRNKELDLNMESLFEHIFPQMIDFMENMKNKRNKDDVNDSFNHMKNMIEKIEQGYEKIILNDISVFKRYLSIKSNDI